MLFSFFEILTIVFLYKNQPLFSSFYLVMILILLFLSGLQLSFKENCLLVIMTSTLISMCNLLFFKWAGLQNILNLGLFNLAFISVLFFSSQLKHELLQLNKSLVQTASQLKSKAELSRLLIENMPVGVMALSSQNEFIFANVMLQEKLKLDQNSVLELLNLKSNGHSEDITYYNSKISDKRIYQIESTSYFDSEYQQNIQLHLVKDTTDIRYLQEQIKHKEKMAAIGQLAAGIAHEIRNPLAGISGSIELLSQDAKNPDDQKLMRIILREIDRLNNLITDFLDYSKPDRRPDQKVDVALIIDEVIQNIKLSPTTPKNLVYEIQIQSSYVLGYSDKLKQAFLNIIVNAVQAMQDRSPCVLSVKTIADDQKICVEISDTGVGMSPESQKRIFEPFYTTKSKGTGLGLAITHKVFESHNALVEIESEMNVGTKFKIIFDKINT
jgi:two-component system, NtrC family, sensor histidine kinase PilS